MESALVSQFLQNTGRPAHFQLEDVRKEASTRTYHRVVFPHSSEPSVILCTGLQSESETYRDFVQLTRFLTEHRIPAPRLLGANESGWLLLSDGGPTELSHRIIHALSQHDTESVRRFLSQAIDLLIQMHQLPLESPVAVRFFDKEKLQWEMDFLFQRIDSVSARAGVALPYNFEFRMFTYEMCALLASEKPFVFTHRDYHSRNLLSHDGGLMVIDYQDARAGLPWYDLASLLYDPYVPLPLADRRFGFHYYCSHAGTEERWSLFLLQSAQRILKALGTYLFMTFEKGQLQYRNSIPEALDRFEEITQLAKLPDSAFVFQSEVRKLVPAWLAVL